MRAARAAVAAIGLALAVLSLAAGGAAAQALATVEAVLAQRPDDDPLRLGYADMLLVSGDWAEAQRQSTALLHGSADRRIALAALQRLDLIAVAQPVERALWAEILPSDNILTAPDADHISTQIGRFSLAPRQSGYGLRVGGRLGRRFAPALGLRALLSLEAERRHYPQTPSLSQWRLRPALSWQLWRPRLRYDLGLSVTRSLYDSGRGDETRARLSLGVMRVMDARTRLQLDLSRDWIDFDRADHLDGTLTRAGASVAYKITPDLTITGTLGAERRQAQMAHNGFVGLSLGGAVAWRASHRDRFSAALRAERSLYDAPTPGFFGTRREDRAIELQIGWQTDRVQIAGATPRIGCTTRRVASSIALYDTTRSECGFRLERRF